MEKIYEEIYNKNKELIDIAIEKTKKSTSIIIKC